VWGLKKVPTSEARLAEASVKLALPFMAIVSVIRNLACRSVRVRKVDAATLQRLHEAPGQVIGPKQQPHLHTCVGGGQQVAERRRRRGEGHGRERLEVRPVEHGRHQSVYVSVDDVAETASARRR
jgi:hypothetical protein